MALKPAARNAPSKLNEVGSSAVHPKTFPPKTRGEISRPVLPSFRLFISILPIFVLRISQPGFDEIQKIKIHREPRQARIIHLARSGRNELRSEERRVG